MHAHQFLGLEPTEDPNRFRLPVVQSLCTWGGFLFGGVGLGAAMTAMALATDRPPVWATAQYLSFARPPSVLDIEVTVPSAGHRLSQARAIAHDGDTEILTVLGAFGDRPHEAEGTWASYPEGIPHPQDCEPRVHRSHHFRGESVMSRFDQRLAKGRHPQDLDGVQGDGGCALWVRIPDDLDVSAASLAILGDYVPFGISQALGIGAGGTSLDNTLRICRLVPTEWILVDVYLHGVAGGFAHGRVHLWSEDRTLLAVASQSTIVRAWRD